MMFAPFIEIWHWVKAHNPGSPFKKRHLSFIAIHYMYMGFLTILGSLLLYAGGRLRYIDALFFGSGAATQSGLNTVDLNNMNTYQQLVIYFTAMLATPIFINTFVVFVRLYWFEKRFQNIAKEARNLRRTRSRAVTRAMEEKDIGHEERGVNGRSIVVLHEDKNGVGQANGDFQAEKFDIGKGTGSVSSSSDNQKDNTSSSDHVEEPPRKSALQTTPSFHRDITFADQMPSIVDPDSPTERLPQQMSHEQHIAFLENQRNPKDKGTLRIPGPRDYDRGDIPETLKVDEDVGNLSRQVTSPVDTNGRVDGHTDRLEAVVELSSDDHPVKRNITIDEPNHPRSNTIVSRPSKLTLRKTATKTSKATPTFERPPSTGRLRARASTFGSHHTSGSRDKEPIPYLSWQPTIGRNSAFIDLTEDQREELGGIEYRSLKTLAVILVLYYVLFHVFAVVTFLPWIVRSRTWGPVVDGYGQSRVWWGIFTPATLFNDAGYTITPDSMISFQTAVLPLLIGSFLIICGNTGFPCMLRFIIWITSKIVPQHSGVWEELKFLLDHPRRCFTLLFPSTATWWLFWILVILNGVDIVFFIILDLNDEAVTSIGAPGYRVLAALFQAASTRTAGTAVVNLANLHPAIQVSYLIMMYISVFPIAVSVRRTNVYEEKSLGIYGSRADDHEDDKEPSYIGAHLRRQLSFDLWYIFLGLFIIAVAEGRHIRDPNEVPFSVFSCLFEIVSAYGTVGLSLGYPTANTSFSGQFSIISKLVIIAMEIRGRHRGLPYELDRAILLPSESLHRKESEDASYRMQRRASNLSTMVSPGPGISRAATNATTSAREQMDATGGNPEGNHTSTSGASHGLGKFMAGLASGPPAVKVMKEKTIHSP